MENYSKFNETVREGKGESDGEGEEQRLEINRINDIFQLTPNQLLKNSREITD